MPTLTRAHSWIFRCKPLIPIACILARLEKFACDIKANRMSLNQRVPGSSPGAPTKFSKHLAQSLESHSDKRSAAILTNRLFLFAPRDASWSPRSAAYAYALHKLVVDGPTDDDLRHATQRLLFEANCALPLGQPDA